MLDTDPFDPNRWEMQDDPSQVSAAKSHVSRRHRNQRFLKGPVPWPWLQRAMVLRGKALAVGVMLWLQKGMTSHRTVHFCLTRAAAEGIPTTTARRAIRELEAAGLVAICRKPGRGLEVTILDAPDSARSV